MPHGTMIARHASGQILARSVYVTGEKHGLHRTWYPNGQDRSHGEYKNGRAVGDHWTWHSIGEVMQFDRYDSADRIVATKKWRSNGLIYMNLVFATDGAGLISVSQPRAGVPPYFKGAATDDLDRLLKDLEELRAIDRRLAVR